MQDLQAQRKVEGVLEDMREGKLSEGNMRDRNAQS